MRICLVHRDLHAVTRGGICTVYRSLAPRLRQAGHEVVLITQETPHPLRLPGIEVVTLPRTEDLTRHRKAVDDALARLSPHVVECSTWDAEVLAYLDRPSAERAPVLVRGDVSAATMGAANLARDERALVHRADRVIAVSQFAARDLADAYDIMPAPVVPNGVDRTRFRPGPATEPTGGFQVTVDGRGRVDSRVRLPDLAARGLLPPPWNSPDGRRRLVWVGRFTPRKGWDLLEELLPAITEHAHVTALLGHSRAYCPVTVTGRYDVTILQDLRDDDLPGFYRAADYLLCTSRWEGFGLAAVEAIACGVPALLPADLAVARELVPGGESLYRDTEALVSMLAAPVIEPPRLPEYFDWDRNVVTTLGLYTDMLAHGSSRENRV